MIPEKVKTILAYYISTKDSDNDFVFPEMKKADLSDAMDIYRKKKVANKKFNTHLNKLAKKAGIKKKITMHIARHSFGNIAADSIHPQMLQKLYRHTDLKTTINYQANFIYKDVDEALKNVINF